MKGTKHLIQCHCVLPQYRKMVDPIFHKFVVYSKIDEDEKVEHKLVRCNNCDAVHRIIDLCRSEIVTKIEDTDVIVDIEELKLGIPDKLNKILEKNNCDIATFEAIDHVLEEESWGSEIVISRQTQGEKINLKILQVKGEDKFRMKTESIEITSEV